MQILSVKVQYKSVSSARLSWIPDEVYMPYIFQSRPRPSLDLTGLLCMFFASPPALISGGDST